MGIETSYAVGPDAPPVRDITVGDLLREAADAAPDRLGLIEGIPDVGSRRQWTYRELLDESLQVARALAARFEPGERVAVWGHNVPEWILVEYGCALAGVVLVTVNPGFRESEARYILQQSRAAGVFAVPEFRGNLMLATARDLQADCPELREVIDMASFDDFVASGSAFDGDLPSVTSTDPMMIQYTSGTTGFPKGAYLHHRGLVNNGWHVADRMGLPEGGVSLGVMPLFHTGGSVLAVLGAVAKQATLVLVEAFEPGLVLGLVETYRCSTLTGVPTMLVAMMEHPSFATTDLSSVRAMCSGGSLVPEQLVRRLEETIGAPFTIVFGQTECSPVASMTRPSDTILDKALTIGGPMPHVEIKIIDPESGDTVPVGATGEY